MGGKRSNLCALPTPLKFIISLLIWFWYERECLYFLYEMIKAAPTQSEIKLLNHAALESEHHTSWNLAATSAKWEMTYRIYLLIGRPISSNIKTWICHKNFEQRDSAYRQEFNFFFLYRVSKSKEMSRKFCDLLVAKSELIKQNKYKMKLLVDKL